MATCSIVVKPISGKAIELNSPDDCHWSFSGMAVHLSRSLSSLVSDEVFCTPSKTL